jgi:hypothetical protein
MRRFARGQRLGEFILVRSFWAVPIESDDYRTGEFKVTLELAKDLHAKIISFGEQQVYRFYVDPTTRETLTGDAKDLEQRASLGEVDTDISAVHTNISYRIAFSNPTQDVDTVTS